MILSFAVNSNLRLNLPQRNHSPKWSHATCHMSHVTYSSSKLFSPWENYTFHGVQHEIMLQSWGSTSFQAIFLHHILILGRYYA